MKMPLALLLLCATLNAQSYVFLSPNVRDRMDERCAHESMTSFEQENFMAVTRMLAARVCKKASITPDMDIFEGQTENGGFVEGCNAEQARYIGAMVARYYHQMFELVFTPDAKGAESLLIITGKRHTRSQVFSEISKLGIKAAFVAEAEGSIQTLIVAEDEPARTGGEALAKALDAGLRVVAGKRQLIGDASRLKAAKVYDKIIAQYERRRSRLWREMQRPEVHDLGLK